MRRKVKRTLKQSTVAAAFVGVFFVVSESASTFFAGSVGPYLGIAAAGLLVFAIAPLQRVADRVANAAMPGVRAPAERGAAEHVELAYRDGVVSRDERLQLDLARHQLALTEAEAAAVEREVLGVRPRS